VTRGAISDSALVPREHQSKWPTHRYRWVSFKFLKQRPQAPELTPSTAIKPNGRVSLRHHRRALSTVTLNVVRERLEFRPMLRGENRFRESRKELRKAPRITESPGDVQMPGLRSKPAWAQTWHLWTVILPHRSITGRLVFGKVWRRHQGRHWVYRRSSSYLKALYPVCNNSVVPSMKPSFSLATQVRQCKSASARHSGQ
jgi:hypothetical protein